MHPKQQGEDVDFRTIGHLLVFDDECFEEREMEDPFREALGGVPCRETVNFAVA